MSTQVTVRRGKDDVAVVDSVNALDELLIDLDAQARQHPSMIDVIASDGRSLALGIGRDMTVLSLAGPSGSPPYFASVGPERDEGLITFDYCGESSSFPLRHAVSMQDARSAAAQFLCGPGLPDAVSWEEV